MLLRTVKSESGHDDGCVVFTVNNLFLLPYPKFSKFLQTAVVWHHHSHAVESVYVQHVHALYNHTVQSTTGVVSLPRCLAPASPKGMHLRSNRKIKHANKLRRCIPQPEVLASQLIVPVGMARNSASTSPPSSFQRSRKKKPHKPGLVSVTSAPTVPSISRHTLPCRLNHVDRAGSA